MAAKRSLRTLPRSQSESYVIQRLSRSTIRGASSIMETTQRKRTSAHKMIREADSKFKGWYGEIAQLKAEKDKIEQNIKVTENNYWSEIDRKYRRIQQINDSYKILTDHYRDDLFALCTKYQGILL